MTTIQYICPTGSQSYLWYIYPIPSRENKNLILTLLRYIFIRIYIYKYIIPWWLVKDLWLGLWCLRSLSTILELYCGGQFYWWRKSEYPVKTTDLSWVTMGFPVQLNNFTTSSTYVVVLTLIYLWIMATFIWWTAVFICWCFITFRWFNTNSIVV